MQSPSSYILAGALAMALLAAGIFFVRRPEKVYRTLSFGQAENKFGVKFFRAVGWFYIAGGALGLVMLAVAAYLNFSRSH
ncbi:MAG: hypothetical protein WA634_14900 [Silvibacterium sp.]